MALTLHPKPKKWPRTALGGAKFHINNPTVSPLLLIQHLPERPTKDFFSSFVSFATKSKQSPRFLGRGSPAFRKGPPNSVFIQQQICATQAFHHHRSPWCCPRTFPKGVVGWAGTRDCSLLPAQDACLSQAQKSRALLWVLMSSAPFLIALHVPHFQCTARGERDGEGNPIQRMVFTKFLYSPFSAAKRVWKGT